MPTLPEVIVSLLLPLSICLTPGRGNFATLIPR